MIRSKVKVCVAAARADVCRRCRRQSWCLPLPSELMSVASAAATVGDGACRRRCRRRGRCLPPPPPPSGPVSATAIAGDDAYRRHRRGRCLPPPSPGTVPAAAIAGDGVCRRTWCSPTCAENKIDSAWRVVCVHILGPSALQSMKTNEMC